MRYSIGDPGPPEGWLASATPASGRHNQPSSTAIWFLPGILIVWGYPSGLSLAQPFQDPIRKIFKSSVRKRYDNISAASLGCYTPNDRFHVRHGCRRLTLLHQSYGHTLRRKALRVTHQVGAIHRRNQNTIGEAERFRQERLEHPPAQRVRARLEERPNPPARILRRDPL